MVINKQKIEFFCFTLIFLFSSININGQIFWLISPETGYYNTGGSLIEHDKDFFLRLDSELQYKFENDLRHFTIGIKLRPEIYGFKNESSIIRLRGHGNYGEDSELFNWNINTTLQKQYYDGENFSYFNELFIISGIINPNFFSYSEFEFTPGYAYQKILIEKEQEIDLFFIEAKNKTVLFDKLSFLYGLYAEKFRIKRKDDFFAEVIKRNSGWRYGISSSVKYFHQIVLTIDYRFLIHSSDLTRWFSYEHWFRFVAGKMITDRFSIFILADLQQRNLKSTYSLRETDIIMLYMPLNLENKFYLKSAYSITNSIDSFIKGGFFKENLFSVNYTRESWYFSFGVEIRN